MNIAVLTSLLSNDNGGSSAPHGLDVLYEDLTNAKYEDLTNIIYE